MLATRALAVRRSPHNHAASPVFCAGLYAGRCLRSGALLCGALGLTLSAGLADLARAQTNWTGATSQDWNDVTNWSSSPNPPTGNFNINVAADGMYPIFSADSTFAPVDIFIGNVAGATARLDQTGGNLATGGPNWLRMGEGGGATGVFNLSGGTFTGRVHMARVATVAGTATINVSGNAVLSSPGEIVVSDGQNNTATAQGTLNVSGTSTVNAEGDLLIAFAGGANSFGEVTIGAGATVNVATATKRWLIVNQWDATQGRLIVNGGTLNLNAVTDLRFSTGNGVGASSVTLNSGAINMQPGSELDFNRGSSSAVNNTVNLNGGVLTVGRVMRFNATNNASAVRRFNFNGGTLRAAGDSATFFGADVATLADVQAGGAFIDSNGFTITVGQTLSGVGGLTKLGAGTLTLSSTNTYSGATTVSAGTLYVAGLPATSGVSVAGGATFGGSGTVAGTTTLNGGAVANTSAATPLTLGALTLGGPGSAINLNLDAGPGIAVTGALTTGGNTATINAAKAAWANGVQQPLVSFGSLSGTVGNFTLGTLTGLNARQTAGPLVNTGTALAVTINGDNPRWTGAVNGAWVVGGPNNWSLVTAGTPTNYIEGDAVLFDDGPTSTTTADITSASGVSPTSVTFNNGAAKPYTINASGGGGIGGAATLTKNGTGAVTISANNSYTGATTINAGTLTLSGNNTTTGATVLNGGTLNLGSATALSAGPITIGAGGAKVIGNTSGAAIVSTANQSQAWNDDFTFAGPNDLDVGTGTVTIGGAGADRTVTVSAGTLAVGELTAPAHGLVKQGAGTLALSSVGVNVAGSNIAGTLNVAAGTVQINRTGETIAGNTGDLYVRGLAGSGTITNGAGVIRWLFVDQPVDTTSTFNGVLDNGAGGGLGLLKRGAGTLTLGGASTMTDLVTVEAGTLNFTGGGSLANAVAYTLAAGSGVLRVSSSTQLSAGTITIASNGAGPAAGAGSTARLELSGNASLFNPITLAPRNDTNGSDAIRNVSGNNTLNGQITIVTGGNQSRIRSDAGKLTIAAGVSTTATSGRNLYLQGAGDGEISGQVLDNGTGVINVYKEGSGTWMLSGFNFYTGMTAVLGGTLSITQPGALNAPGDVSIAAGATLNLANGGFTEAIDLLFLNGVAQLPGTYGAVGSGGGVNETPLITGPGRLAVTGYMLPGDFDRNNVVNEADLAVWRTGMANYNATGDTNGDGVTDGADLLIWQRNLGRTFPGVAASAAVPEPAAGVLALCGLAALAVRRSRQSRC